MRHKQTGEEFIISAPSAQRKCFVCRGGDHAGIVALDLVAERTVQWLWGVCVSRPTV